MEESGTPNLVFKDNSHPVFIHTLNTVVSCYGTGSGPQAIST